MSYAAHRAVRAAIGVSAIAVTIASGPSILAQRAAGGPASVSTEAARPGPNYELASAWTSQKVAKLVFDTSVTPRWLETSDRFWYSYNTREGRRFMLVDPVKKTKGTALRPREDGRSADHDHPDSLRRSAPALHPGAVHQERRGLRVRSPGAARRRDPHDQTEADHHGPGRARRGERLGGLALVRITHASLPRRPAGAAGPARAGRPARRRPRRPRRRAAADQDAALRIRDGVRQGVAQRGLSRGAAHPDLGLLLARPQDDPVRAQQQPLHDGRRQLREGAEEPERQVDRRAPAHHRRRRALRLWRRRPRPAAATAAAAATTATTAGRPGAGAAGAAGGGCQEHPRARRQRRLVARFDQVRADPPRCPPGQGSLGHQRARHAASDARDLPLRDARRGEHSRRPRCGCSTSPPAAA